jgi:hypothetical protein
MPRTNKVSPNTAGGELSPLLYGRIDLPLYAKSLSKCENFIVLPQGSAQFRTGTVFVKQTRLNKTAAFIPFQFNDIQSYLIEATHQRFRFYKDNGAVLETARVITGVTNANPGVITSNSHGFSNGDEVYIDSVGGTTRLNGRFYLVAGAAANTFTLTDIFGNAIDTGTYGTYTSGGTVARVYEITTPYEEVDLPFLQFAQNADTMYIAHRNYAPRKLTRTGHAAWTLATYVRTSDPFAGLTDTINAATQANPGVLTTTAAHGLSVGDVIFISGVVGMTELNSRYYKVGTVPTTTTLTLTDLDGTVVNTTAYTAYGSAGTITASDKFPRSVVFLDTGRLLFGGTKTNPETVWGSKSPNGSTTQYDDFTTGTGATDGFIFTFSPIHGKVDAIQWLANTSKYVAVGAYSSIRRAYGATEQEPISPTSFTAKSVNARGAEPSVPVSTGNYLFYIRRAGRSIHSLEYDISVDGYVTNDRNLVSDHLTKPGVKQLVEQLGSPDIIWCVRNDGRLLGLTYKEKEDISGWHRHMLGGSHVNSSGITKAFGKVIAAGRMPRATSDDQLWLIVERKIGANTFRSVEYFSDIPLFPLRNEFYDNLDEDDNGDADDMKFANASYEKQKDANHLDMSVVFDGSAVGTAAGATMTPAAGATTVGSTAVTFTASVAVFTSAMVGREIWKKYDENGDGGGRAIITGFTSSTVVECTIDVAFDSVSAIAAGSWFLTASSVSGLDYLEGQSVYVVADGALDSEAATVTNGSVTLTAQSSKAVIGFFSMGTIESLNIDSGGVRGSAQAKPRGFIKVATRFLNTLGCWFGSSIYRLQRLVFSEADDISDRPPPLFTGIKDDPYEDDWESDDKRLVYAQRIPAPCTIVSFDPYLATTDE